jgi:hypothetical protein
METGVGSRFTAVTIAGVTLMLAVPLMPPEVAVIVAEPVACASTLPEELTLVCAVEELQLAVAVRF